MPVAKPNEFRFAALDLFRFFAALIVVVFHYTYNGFGEDWSPALAFPEVSAVTRYGYLGVQLFFMISGFVIALSAENHSKFAFVRSRFARLYPAFFVCMTLTATAIALFGGARLNVDLPQYLANLTMVPIAYGERYVDVAYWSIVREIIFYGWAMLFLTGAWSMPRLKLVMVSWLLLSLADVYLLHMSFAASLILLTAWAPFFCLGILIYIFRSGRGDSFFALLFAIAFVMAAREVWAQPDKGNLLLTEELNRPIAVAIQTFNVALVAFAAAFSTRIKGRPSWIMLGGLTYPLYLIHENVGLLIYEHAAPEIGRWPAFGLAFAIAISIAYLIWRFVEPGGKRIVFMIFDHCARNRKQLRPIALKS